MNRAPSSFGTILKINLSFLGACVLSFVAWAIWPSSPEWWGFGLLSIILGGAAVGNIFSALRAMVKLYEREKELARFAATSRAPTPSDLADHEALRNAGMIDD